MRNSIFWLLMAVLFSASSFAQAAVFQCDWKASGDGLLTFDDVNQREWLDLTETQLFNFPGATLEEQYQAVIAETMPDGMFEDFTVAGSDDVFALAESAGIDTTTLDFATNSVPADGLVDLLGNTFNPIFTTRNTASHGIIVTSSPELSSLGVTFTPGGRTESFAGLWIPIAIGEDYGAWLYRPVPEPGSLFLAIGVFSWLILHRPIAQLRPY